VRMSYWQGLVLSLLSLCFVYGCMRELHANLPGTIFLAPIIALVLARGYQELVAMLTTRPVQLSIRIPPEIDDYISLVALRQVRYGRSNGDGAGQILNNDIKLRRSSLNTYVGEIRSSKRLGVEFSLYVDLAESFRERRDEMMNAWSTLRVSPSPDEIRVDRVWLNSSELPQAITSEGYKNNWIPHDVKSFELGQDERPTFGLHDQGTWLRRKLVRVWTLLVIHASDRSAIGSDTE
jgi:hypothetical protein